MEKLEERTHSRTEDPESSRNELIGRVFYGARTPILALSLPHEGPPRVVDCNKAASDLLGYDRSELVDRSVEFLYSSSEARGDIWKPLRTAGKRNLDIVGHELKRKDGSIFVASMKVSPLLNSKGTHVGSITVLSDLTQNKKMEERRFKYEGQLLSLHRHSVQLSSAASPDAIIAFSLEAMQETLNTRNVDFGLIEKDQVRIVQSAGAHPNYTSVCLPRSGRGVVVKAANEGKTVLVHDTRKESLFIDDTALGLNNERGVILSELVTPVIVDNEPIAVLNVESEQLNGFSSEDQKYLEVIAFHTSLAFKRLKYKEKLSTLHAHAMKLSVANTVEEIVNATLDAMQSNLGFEYADLRIVEDGWLRCKEARGMDVINTDLALTGPGVTVAAATTKKTVRVADTRNYAGYVDRIHDGKEKTPTMLSELAVPVIVHGEAVAVLNVERRKPNAIRDSDQELLETLAAHVSTAMERIRSVDVVRQSEARYRALFDGASDAVFIHDMGGRFLEVNELACKRLGYGREELLKMTPAEINGAESSATVKDRVDELKRGGHQYAEVVQIRRDGLPIPTELSSRLIEFNGKLVVMSIARDITLRKKMEEELRTHSEKLEAQVAERTKNLRESEQKLRAVVYDCPIPQFVVDRDHTIVYWNKALEEATRIKAEEVVGTRQQWRAFYEADRPCLVDLLIDNDQASIPRLYAGKFTPSKVVEGAFEATDYFPRLGEGGQGKWLHFTAAAIRDDEGSILGGVETLEDMTELKRLAEKSVKETPS